MQGDIPPRRLQSPEERGQAHIFGQRFSAMENLLAEK
jgi:hypothetical protein